MTHDGFHSLHLFKYEKKIASPEVYAPILLAHVNLVDLTGGVPAAGMPTAIGGGIGSPLSSPTSFPFSSSSSSTSTSWPTSEGPALSSFTAEPTLTAAFANSKIQLTKDQFMVQTTLCSTKLTQDMALLNLLRWEVLGEDQLRSVLKNFTFIGPVEIVKYFQDIFDTLFAIIQQSSKSHMPGDIPELAVSAVIFILNIIIADRRFTSFRPILDLYVANHFGKKDAVDQVWNALLSYMLHLATFPEDPVIGTSSIVFVRPF